MHDNVDLRVCKICKGKYEHEIVFATKIWKKNISGLHLCLQILQNT